MAMIDINWQPDDRQLRQFGLFFWIFSVLLGGILWWRIGLGPISWTLWAVGPVVALVGWIFPRALKPLFIGLTLLAYPIGFVVSLLLLGLTYYLVVGGIGLLFRLFGRDPMHRKFDREAESYWIRRPPPPGAARYFRQF